MDKWVYIVYIDDGFLQCPGDDIDSIWFSRKKAEKERNKLAKKYGEEHVTVLSRRISK